MKQVTNKMVKAILVAGMAVTTMIGCADNNKSNSNAVRTSVPNAVMPTAQGQFGVVTATANVMNDVSNLLGGVSTGQLGTINPTGSIFMWGHVEFPQVNGNVQYLNSSVSFLGLQIYDSQALAGQAQPIPITIGNNSLGQGSVTLTSPNNYAADITFKDQAGTIRLVGQAQVNVVNAAFTGTIYYTMTSGTSGTLGNFTIPTCAFFKCQ